MAAEHTVPIIVGVTGHRELRPGDREALLGAVKGELERLRALCPHSELKLLCSLAEGADLLCAKAAEELGIPLIAVLPLSREEYGEDFTPHGLGELDAQLARAEQVFLAPETEAAPPEGENREYRYRQAGIYVSAHSHVLLALWDGQPGPAAPCGTAAAVSFALEGNWRPLTGAAQRSGENEGVVHILTPRGDAPGEAGTLRRLGDWAALEDILGKTDDFNRQAARCPDSGGLLPPDRGEDPVLDRLEGVEAAADRLSLENAKKYRRVMALLAAAGTLVTLAFLLYDEAEAIWMILVCGAMLLFSWGCTRRARRTDCHRRFIEYRALAECLRVQLLLRYGGSGISAGELLTWTQQEETAWIMDALFALEMGEKPRVRRSILECWVEDQRSYHEKAGEKAAGQTRASGRVVSAALCLSVTLYCAAVAFELLWGGMLFPPVLRGVSVELCRTVLKIVMGGISAATLFVSSYYGRLSLPRVLSDHRKMERFYAHMARQLRLQGQTEELLRVLAREELTENGNWYSYQSDNTPDLNL